MHARLAGHRARTPISLTVKCDRCESEATVHEVTIKGGKRQERHLCESCAKADGLPVQPHAPITQLLTQYITSQVQATGLAGAHKPTAAGRAPPSNSCPVCALTHAQFRQTGLLGCPHCYAAFEGQLSPLLARAHDGGTQHTGKSPRRISTTQAQVPQMSPERPPAKAKSDKQPAPDVAAQPSAQAAAQLAAQVATQVASQIAETRKHLAEAIATENYEQAAALRDELIRLESPPKAARKATPTKPPAKPNAKSAGDDPAIAPSKPKVKPEEPS